MPGEWVGYGRLELGYIGSAHGLSQFDLEVCRSGTLPDAPEVAGNLAGLYCNM